MIAWLAEHHGRDLTDTGGAARLSVLK